MTVFLIAGEASGDTHAARLMQAMKVLQSDIRFVGLGGDAMRREGAVLYQDYREMAFMGIFAVLSNLSKVRRNFKIAREALLKEKPDVLILIDYPSFNLRMAQFCREHLPATRIVYYIPPKVWAWKRWRVHKIARLCDEVLGIFPFEPDFYSRYGYKCTYIGNPTVEEVTSTEWRTSENVQKKAERAGEESDLANGNSRIIAVLPGSRRSEIEHCLRKMVEAAQLAAPGYDIVVAGAEGQSRELYEQQLKISGGLDPSAPSRDSGERLRTSGGRYGGKHHLSNSGERLRTSGDSAPKVRVVFGSTHDILRQADAAIINSGTATLEGALLRCPQVAVYHIAVPHAILFSRLLFSSPYFTLPNILLQREVISELIGYRFTVQRTADELRKLLQTDERQWRMSENVHNSRLYNVGIKCRRLERSSSENVQKESSAPFGTGETESARQRQLQGYEEIANMLGKQNAAETAAKIILKHRE